jgi:heme/copper-type cytochrome/quinol oxidase subunit 2
MCGTPRTVVRRGFGPGWCYPYVDMQRLLIVAAAAVVAGGLFLALRPNDDDDGTTATGTTTTTATTTPTITEPSVPPPPRPPSPPPPAQVRIVVRDGQPVGGVRRVTVGKGRRVVLMVTSDVADHVHLHGYNVMRDVAPGMPARLAFRATIVGTVEVELEDRGLRLATITTQP